MIVANFLISSVYSHEGCYRSVLLLNATQYVRNGAVIAQEVCFEIALKAKYSSLGTRNPTSSCTMTDALVL